MLVIPTRRDMTRLRLAYCLGGGIFGHLGTGRGVAPATGLSRLPVMYNPRLLGGDISGTAPIASRAGLAALLFSALLGRTRRPRGGNLPTYDATAVGDVLLRFLEGEFGACVVIRVFRPYAAVFSGCDAAGVALLRSRFSLWLRGVGENFTWRYLATVFHLSFCCADATTLVSWLHARLRTMGLFAHGRFLNLFLFLLGIFFNQAGYRYGVVGLRCRVAGKISVAGNARKRVMLFRRGKTNVGGVQSRVVSDFHLVRTSTGCLGLTVWLFYRP